MFIPTFDDVRAAHNRIRSIIHKTPVFKSAQINSIANCEVFFKCENLQKVGAFKFRGATNAILSLPAKSIQNGVATHSSGNHAQALALAAKMNNVPAYIVMPSNSPKVKVNAVAGYGAEIIFCEPNLKARESTLAEVVSKTNATFIHPYNNPFIIAGQGTAAKELIEDIGFLDFVVAPVGGGGLLSGTAISTKALIRNSQVIGAEPAGADDAFRSFYGNEIVPSENPKTICDGLLTSLGDLTYSIIKEKVNEIITVTDEQIISAMKLIWERMKLVVEPSSAVTLATILSKPELFAGKRIGVIISGGNVDLNSLPFNNFS